MLIITNRTRQFVHLSDAINNDKGNYSCFFSEKRKSPQKKSNVLVLRTQPIRQFQNNPTFVSWCLEFIPIYSLYWLKREYNISEHTIPSYSFATLMTKI